MDAETFHIGQEVTCRPSGLQGKVYAVAPGVVYIKLQKGEIITSPYDMLDLVQDVSRAALQGHVTCWKCGAELPRIGDTCSACGDNQVPF
jgi:hypothetical protein